MWFNFYSHRSILNPLERKVTNMYFEEKGNYTIYDILYNNGETYLLLSNMWVVIIRNR